MEFLRHFLPQNCFCCQVAELSHGVTVEMTALRARLAGLEEENVNLEQQIREEVQEEYEGSIQASFAMYLHIKVTCAGRPGRPAGSQCGRAWRQPHTQESATGRLCGNKTGRAQDFSGSELSLQRVRSGLSLVSHARHR